MIHPEILVFGLLALLAIPTIATSILWHLLRRK